MILPHILDLVSVCAAKGIEKAVISPGSRSAALTIAFEHHSKIEVIMVPDERSAGFIALGLSQQSKLPTALVCTSGSALLNYFPAISEAYYQEIPLLVLSADRPSEWIDQYDGQTIQQDAVYDKHVKRSFTLPTNPTGKEDLWQSNRKINEALNAVENAGDTLKSTAEDAKKTMEDAKKAMEAEIGSNNDGACLLLPSVWLFVLVPNLML